MAINTELFISAIQSKPPIWHSKNPQHGNRTITRKLWNEIKEQFPGSEEKLLRKKWKNLRDQFRKEKKKCPTPRSGDGGEEIEITWPYFQIMQFVNDDITPEVMTGNLHDSDSESRNPEIEEQSNIANVTSPDTSTCSSRTNASKRNKTASDYRDELIECERKKNSLIEQKIASNNDQPEKCDDYHFFMSLLPQMKQFSELQKLRIRNKINQVIIDEAERMQFSSHQRCEENYGRYSTGNYNNY